ncbi:MAG: sugar transferase, partial [Eubacterium sp.]
MSKRQKSYLVFKRCFDLIFALVLLVILSPIMLIAMIWIKLESNGSVIFKQNRPGRNQKIFPMYKFRSMRIETEKNGKALSDKERLTVSGKILRKTSIDELPQLINIIK